MRNGFARDGAAGAGKHLVSENEMGSSLKRSLPWRKPIRATHRSIKIKGHPIGWPFLFNAVESNPTTGR